MFKQEVFRKARQAASCIIFFDEIDSIAPRRSTGSGTDSHVTERMVSQMLTEIDGLEDLKGVTIIGATNRPDIIDEALLRPGRFDRIIEVPPPDKDARRQILLIHTKRKPLDSSCDFNKLVELTDGYTGADIEAIVNAAAMASIKDHIYSLKKSDNTTTAKSKVNQDNTSKSTSLRISMTHFEEALRKIKKRETHLPSLSK